MDKYIKVTRDTINTDYLVTRREDTLNYTTREALELHRQLTIALCEDGHLNPEVLPQNPQRYFVIDLAGECPEDILYDTEHLDTARGFLTSRFEQAHELEDERLILIKGEELSFSVDRSVRVEVTG